MILMLMLQMMMMAKAIQRYSLATHIMKDKETNKYIAIRTQK